MHAREQIDRYLCDDLGSWSAARMRRHLSACPACRERYDEQILLVRALHGDAGAPGADELARMVRRVERELGLTQKPDAGQRALKWALGIAGAAAACLALLLVLWSPAEPEAPKIQEPSWLESGPVASSLVTEAGVRIEIHPHSRYRVCDAGRLMELASGKVCCRVEPGTGGFSVRTPEARVDVRGTSFVVDRLSEARTTVRVIEGRVEVSGEKGKALVLDAGQRCIVKAGGAPVRIAYKPAAKPPTAKPRSDWDWFWERLGKDLSQATEDIGDLIFGD
ncbi:MAG: FecR domain-containing protein [Deltaproteobacteria bacterium]|nr:FecR domain-containing protein [Deltaproteobacteria bacterium]